MHEANMAAKEVAFASFNRLPHPWLLVLLSLRHSKDK